jgi:ATP diphosphatase
VQNEDDANRKTLADLLAVMAALRTPGTGCPWDLTQSFATIAPYTIEEAYEVADAITRNDLADLKDELGDLLLQVVYHARMAEEQGAFAFADVADAITRKMIRRHPHVFGSAEERAAGAQPGFWARIKADETAERSRAEEPRGGHDPGSSSLGGVPVALPALTRAVKLQDKAARVGFDWPSLAPVFDKMREELDELAEIALHADQRAPDPLPDSPVARQRLEEELGDVLFVVANVARHLGIDPEAALRAANGKFVRRFRYIEEALAARGTTAEDSTLAEMDALWDEAKARERR